MTFTIPGKAVGYYTRGAHPNWTRMNQYHAYKRLVQLCAQAAGVELPLSATKESPVKIDVVAYFPNGTHCDTENVRKGVVDALFYGGNGDKYAYGSHDAPRYDKLNPRVEVLITREARV